MGRGLIQGTIWKIPCHNLFIAYFTLTLSKHWLLYIADTIFELTNCGNKSLREFCLCSTCKYFIFVSSRVSKRYKTMSICTMTLESVCKIYKTLTFEWKFLFNTTYIWANYSVLSYLIFIQIFWNVLIDWNTILCIFLYTIFPCIFTYKVWHHCAETASWIRGAIWIFESKYPYWPWWQITNTNFRLLLDMQKRTYCNKIGDNCIYLFLRYLFISKLITIKGFQNNDTS